jgi:hypothetical protein
MYGRVSTPAVSVKPHSDCARRRAASRDVAEIEHIDMNGSTQTALSRRRATSRGAARSLSGALRTCSA